MDFVNANDSVWGAEGEAGNSSERPELYIFHQTAVKVPLLLLYTVVFILAFFGEYKLRFLRTCPLAWAGMGGNVSLGPRDATAMYSAATVFGVHG